MSRGRSDATLLRAPRLERSSSRPEHRQGAVHGLHSVRAHGPAPRSRRQEIVQHGDPRDRDLGREPGRMTALPLRESGERSAARADRLRPKPLVNERHLLTGYRTRPSRGGPAGWGAPPARRPRTPPRLRARQTVRVLVLVSRARTSNAVLVLDTAQTPSTNPLGESFFSLLRSRGPAAAPRARIASGRSPS
jgi:hypothetical protein